MSVGADERSRTSDLRITNALLYQLSYIGETEILAENTAHCSGCRANVTGSAWQLQDPVGRKNRGLLSLMRRHQWNLNEAQRIRLTDYLEQYPVLKALYYARHRLNRLMSLKTLNAKRAQRFIPRLLELLQQLVRSPAKALADTLLSWIEPIVRMWRFSKTNSITEGFHNKMEMISRRAYGFRNFENYRIRVLAHCGWNGVINRVWRMPIPPKRSRALSSPWRPKSRM